MLFFVENNKNKNWEITENGCYFLEITQNIKEKRK
jgi:predicted transcriptional regulator